MKSIFILASALVFFGAQVYAQQGAPSSNTGANQTASGEQAGNYLMGATSAGAGAATMKATCGKAMSDHDAYDMLMCYAVGPSGIASAALDIATGHGRQGTINDTAPETGIPFNSGDATDQQLAQDTLNNAIQTAQQYGVDPTDPASMAAAQAKAGVGGSGEAAQALANYDTPAYVQSAVNKAVNDIKAKFHVTGVALDGDGGMLARHSHKINDIDLAKLFGDSDSPTNRDPASIDGLQKTFGGDAVGVAEDNIFKQVSRRYQSKIAAKAFLSM